MTTLDRLIQATLPNPLFLPAPLIALFRWIESNGFAENTPTGRVGYLYPVDQVRKGWTETQRPGGTYIEFYAEQHSDQFYIINEQIKDRLRIFARTGGDGSVAALWLDDDNEQKIVHIGSGSGSTLACILAESPVDFLRLLAIGYDEICWHEDFGQPPAHSFKENEFTVTPNTLYQEWVKREFNTSIPQTALDIVKTPAEFGDTHSPDKFCQWLEKHSQ